MPNNKNANLPFHDRKLDMDIMLQLIKRPGSLKFSNDVPPIKSVSVVGALLKNTFQPYKTGDLYSKDMSLIVDILGHFNSAGIHLAPNAEFHLYNLLPPIKSDILLAHDEKYAQTLPQSDLIIIAFLTRMGYTPLSDDYNTDHGFSEFSNNIYVPWPSIAHSQLLSVSELNGEHEIWPRVARNLGAQFVVTASGCPDEFQAKDFGGSEYEGIILPENKHRIGTDRYSMSIVARNFANIAGATNEKSIIGEGLRNPRALEAITDPRQEAHERMRRSREMMDAVNKAMALGDMSEAVQIMKSYGLDP